MKNAYVHLTLAQKIQLQEKHCKDVLKINVAFYISCNANIYINLSNIGITLIKVLQIIIFFILNTVLHSSTQSCSTQIPWASGRV